MLKQLLKMLVSFFFNYGVGDDHGKDRCGNTVKKQSRIGTIRHVFVVFCALWSRNADRRTGSLL